MNIQELAESAARVINAGGENMMLVMPHRKRVYDTRYLAGRKSPLGQYVSYVKDGELIRFEAVDVLAFAVAHGAKVDVVLPDGVVIRL